jgi:hypothetical protein
VLPELGVSWSRVWESNPRPHDYKSRLERPAGVASYRYVASDLGFRGFAVRLVLARIVPWWAVRGQSVGTERLPRLSADRSWTGVTARRVTRRERARSA